MKLKNVLTLALLCGTVFAVGSANAPIMEVSAATETITAVSYNDDAKQFTIEKGFQTYRKAGDEFEATGSASFKLYEGQYLASTSAYYVEANTAVTFSIDWSRVNSKSATKNTMYFRVINADTNQEVGYVSGKPASKTIGNNTFDVNVSTAGNYKFKIESYSSSDSSNCNKVQALNITYTSPNSVEPEVPDVSSDKFNEQKTLSQLAFSFSKTVVDGVASYSITEAVLRYGAAITWDEWSSLKVSSFGVAVAKNADLNGTTLTELLANSDLSNEEVRNAATSVKFAVGDVANVTRVNAEFEVEENGEFVLFNARIEVPEANYDTGINAVAYVVFEENGVNKTSLLTEVVNDSVVNQANYYLANGEYNEDVTNALTILAR